MRWRRRERGFKARPRRAAVFTLHAVVQLASLLNEQHTRGCRKRKTRSTGGSHSSARWKHGCRRHCRYRASTEHDSAVFSSAIDGPLRYVCGLQRISGQHLRKGEITMNKQIHSKTRRGPVDGCASVIHVRPKTLRQRRIASKAAFAALAMVPPLMLSASIEARSLHQISSEHLTYGFSPSPASQRINAPQKESGTSDVAPPSDDAATLIEAPTLYSTPDDYDYDLGTFHIGPNGFPQIPL